MITQLSDVNPTKNPASSSVANGGWDLMWTTEDVCKFYFFYFFKFFFIDDSGPLNDII